jgi:two-component system CheB/CheR fusion protein
LNIEAVDVGELLRSLSQAISEDLVSKGITLETLGSPQLICNCDRVRLEQIIWDLIGNAIKFTPKGGRITLDLQSEGEFAKFTVSDTGAGIPPAFLPHVFDMFSQAAAPYISNGNTGLEIGLSLVKELAKAHGGRVEVTSKGPNQGSTFTVWLPLHSGKVEVGNVSKPSTSLAGQRLLMVDDDAETLETFAALLRFEGAQVDTADNALSALHLLKSNTYDLLISDLSMPDMDGFALISSGCFAKTQIAICFFPAQ